jgi:hypothetical protein
MSSEPLARPEIAAEAPIDMDYEAVYAAVTATERGRWFLAEYARRNRDADTDRVLGAIARMESAIRGALAQTPGLFSRNSREIAEVVDPPSVRSDPLAVLGALSERELIALFG